jgi:ubiquitin carboxyl-terminal hydrolase 8
MDFSKYNDKGHTGLVNLGNTCFLNACLQALNHTYELNEVLDSIFVSNPKHNKRIIIKDLIDSEILIEWNDLRTVMWSQNGVVSPNKFVFNVQKIARNKNKEIFTGWSQNDMPEFLLFIIECIHNSISRSVNIRISGTSESDTDELAIACYKMLKESYFKEYSEIMELFYGILVSEIVSLDGLHKHSIKPENYFILDLPIPNTNRKKINIYDCFDSYVHPEILVGDNAWYNEKTKLKEDIHKRITFWSFPKILIITLKRFSPDGTSKKQDLIDFPLDNLDLSKYINGYNASQYKYELYAICNHIGNVYMGHYTAFVKKYNGEWIHYNDQNVEVVKNTEDIITPMAYCFFYRKKNK